MSSGSLPITMYRRQIRSGKRRLSKRTCSGRRASNIFVIIGFSRMRIADQVLCHTLLWTRLIIRHARIVRVSLRNRTLHDRIEANFPDARLAGRRTEAISDSPSYRRQELARSGLWGFEFAAARVTCIPAAHISNAVFRLKRAPRPSGSRTQACHDGPQT
jgi:hypothetical protein